MLKTNGEGCDNDKMKGFRFCLQNRPEAYVLYFQKWYSTILFKAKITN